MSGAPGSGKSTVANLLAQSIDGVVINHDLIESFFLENDISFDRSARLTYRLDWVLAEDMIRQGRNVIIDSTCNYNEVLDQGTAPARQYGYGYISVDLLDRRLRNRVPLRSQRTGVNRPPLDASDNRHGEDYQALFKRWIECPCPPADGAIVADSTDSPEECLDYILKQPIPPADRTLHESSSPGGSGQHDGVASIKSPIAAPEELENLIQKWSQCLEAWLRTQENSAKDDQ